MLVPLNQRIHRSLLDLWEDTLVALTELEFDHAETAWTAFARDLEAHQQVEESLFPDWPEGPAPRGGSQDLVAAEHRRLGELVVIALDHIVSLSSRSLTPPEKRRALVSNLDPFLRVRHLLEHHGEREDRLVYPHLEATLPPPTLEALAQRFAALLVSVPGTP